MESPASFKLVQGKMGGGSAFGVSRVRWGRGGDGERRKHIPSPPVQISSLGTLACRRRGSTWYIETARAKKLQLSSNIDILKTSPAGTTLEIRVAISLGMVVAAHWEL